LAYLSAGNRTAINNAMIAMTTKSSIKVNALLLCMRVFLFFLDKDLPSRQFSPETTELVSIPFCHNHNIPDRGKATYFADFGQEIETVDFLKNL